MLIYILKETRYSLVGSRNFLRVYTLIHIKDKVDKKNKLLVPIHLNLSGWLIFNMAGGINRQISGECNKEIVCLIW